ncbi:MAG: cytochrome c4 [Idiomarina sp.]|nr:cytochrome c4 [Idiomarina sp.]
MNNKQGFVVNCTLGALLLGVSLGVSAKGDSESGQQLSMKGDGSGAPCMACHGPNGEGNAAGAFPYIAGMNEQYLYRQMKAYQTGERNNAVMSMNVDNFNEQQLNDIAAYYASLSKPASTSKDTDSELLKQGERLVSIGNWDDYIPPCSTCHGPNNRGVNENFPGIAGQHASYIKQQINAWKNGNRKTDKVQLMEAVAKRLSDAQIEAVSAYLASIPASE